MAIRQSRSHGRRSHCPIKRWSKYLWPLMSTSSSWTRTMSSNCFATEPCSQQYIAQPESSYASEHCRWLICSRIYFSILAFEPCSCRILGTRLWRTAYWLQDQEGIQVICCQMREGRPCLHNRAPRRTWRRPEALVGPSLIEECLRLWHIHKGSRIGEALSM